MTLKLELGPEAEARLLAAARARGISLESAAESLLKEALAAPILSTGQLTTEEFHAMLNAIAEGSDKLPNLPTDSFSRESFYEDPLDGGNALPRR